MIQKDVLQERCLNMYMSGKAFTLNNGAEVTIPSMPIGAVSGQFLRMKDALGEQPKVQKKDASGKVEYEKFTLDDGTESKRPVMIDNPKYVNLDSQEGMINAGKMLTKIIQLNFKITDEEADGLFSMSHFGAILSWFFTGQENANLMSVEPEEEGSTKRVPTETPSQEEGAELLA